MGPIWCFFRGNVAKCRGISAKWGGRRKRSHAKARRRRGSERSFVFLASLRLCVRLSSLLGARRWFWCVKRRRCRRHFRAATLGRREKRGQAPSRRDFRRVWHLFRLGASPHFPLHRTDLADLLLQSLRVPQLDLGRALHGLGGNNRFGIAGDLFYNVRFLWAGD